MLDVSLEMRWNNAAMIKAFSSWDELWGEPKLALRYVYLTLQPTACECCLPSAIYSYSQATILEGLSQSSQNSIRHLHSIKSKPTPTPSAGFEPAIPAIKRPQNYALDSRATGTGSCLHSLGYFCNMPFSLRGGLPNGIAIKIMQAFLISSCFLILPP